MKHFGGEGELVLDFYNLALKDRDMSDFEEFQLFRRTYAVYSITMLSALSECAVLGRRPIAWTGRMRRI